MNPEDMILMVTKTIVDHPKDVSVVVEDLSTHYVYHLHLNPQDRYRIVTSEAYGALCTLLKAAGGKLNKRIELDVVRV